MAGTKHSILANVPTWVTPGGTYVAVNTSDLATQTELDAHTGDTSDAHDASAISILDAGGDFTATDVEGALAELQADHEADATALTDHTGDTSGAHAASAIAFTPAGTIAATDVQAAIEEVATEAGGGAPADVDYLVGTASGGLSAEIVVGTTPGGELGGTWASPTVDTTHSGSSHAGVISTHEAAADPHTGYQKESEKDAANGYLGLDASKIAAIDGGFFQTTRASAVNASLQSLVTGDTQSRWIMLASGAMFWGPGGATAVDVGLERGAANRLSLATGDEFQAGAGIFPGTPAGARQTATRHFGGTGAPNNADGANGDFYFRSDGGALTTIYHKRVGAWVGII